MMRRARRFLLAASVVLFVPAFAHAQDIVNKEADERFKRGMQLISEGKPDEARLQFQEAYSISQDAKTLWNLALAELDSKHPLEALRHFRQYGNDPKGEPEKKAKLPQLIDEASKQTGHIHTDAPAGAKVTLDGAAVATPVPDPIDVAPGKHSLEAQANGGTSKVVVDAPAGQVVTAHFDLPAAPTGASLLDRNPPPQPPPNNDHTVQPSGGFWTTRNTVAIALGAGAVVAVGVGTVFGLSANGHEDDATALRASTASQGCVNPSNPGCADLSSANSSQRSAATTANIFFIAGGVLAAGAIGTLLFWPSDKHTERAAYFAPALAPGAAGVQLGGRF